MNQEVTATGMNVRTQVGDNLLIAADTLTSTSKQDDENFKNSYVADIKGLLEPVSTVNGKDFFYNSTKNVAATGDALTDTYVDYDATGLTVESGETLNNFNLNYGTDGTAVGFVDYVFQLKAINGATASEIRLTTLKLTYGATPDNGKAYRVAVFYEDITAGTATNDAGTLLTIIKSNGASNFATTKAVSSTSELDDVTYCSSADEAVIAVAANTTKYYKIVVRLWLEGEDTTCNNATYMSLTDKWGLDLKFSLVAASATANAVTYITLESTAKADLTSASLGSETLTINSQVYTKITSVTLDGEPLYAQGTTLTSTSRIFKINDSLYPEEVTHRCTPHA